MTVEAPTNDVTTVSSSNRVPSGVLGSENDATGNPETVPFIPGLRLVCEPKTIASTFEVADCSSGNDISDRDPGGRVLTMSAGLTIGIKLLMVARDCEGLDVNMVEAGAPTVKVSSGMLDAKLAGAVVLISVGLAIDLSGT